MKKSFKKCLSLFLAVIMVCGALPLGLHVLETQAADADYKNGDIIEFGSYPQSEVKDSALLAELNKLSKTWTSYGYYIGNGKYGSMEQSDYMKYADVTYNGNKYRAVTFSLYRPYATFIDYGACQYENGYLTNTVYWFRYEPLKWHVLDPETGFVICETIIDSQPYNDTIYKSYDEYYNDSACTIYANNYAESSIRKWLNDDFYNTAFDSFQKSQIKTIALDNSIIYDEYSRNDSAVTNDKVFLLSHSEVMNISYFVNDAKRVTIFSDYSKCQGLMWMDDEEPCWSLRSAGRDSESVFLVASVSGYVGDFDTLSCANGYGVRPALKLSLNDNIVINGEIIEFGSYPQSRVTDSTLLSTLNSRSKTWASYGYYSGTGDVDDGQMTSKDYTKYADVTYNGNKYRAVTFSSYRPYYTGYTSSSSYTYQDDNGYTTNTVYWFKYEPLKWRVLDSSTGLVICETIIDSQAYNNYILYANGEYWGNSSKTYYANNYENSSIREWLNDDFYNTAFTSTQKSQIKTTTLDNSAYSTSYSKYDSASTNDKVFLLSYSEAINSSYFANSAARPILGSDYAKCQGLYVGSNKCSCWRLRSAGYYSDNTCGVNSSGVVYNFDTSNTGDGVRPALTLNLGSAISESYTEDQLEFIQKHTEFVNSGEMKKLIDDYGIYNNTWQYENGKRLWACRVWDTLGDVGEIVTFKFDKLQMSADYYELFLGDLIINLNNFEKQKDFINTDVFGYYSEYTKKIDNIFKDIDDWNSDVDNNTKIKITKFLENPKYELDSETKSQLSSLLSKSFVNKNISAIQSVFEGFDAAVDICDRLSTAGDIVGAFTTAYNAYIMTLAVKNMNEEFFDICSDAAQQMKNDGRAKYAGWFEDALNKYKEVLQDEGFFNKLYLDACNKGLYIGYEVIGQEVLKNITYAGIGKLLKLGSGGPVAIVTFAYSATYGLLDLISGLGNRAENYYYLAYVCPFEYALGKICKNYGNQLVNGQGYETAVYFDVSFRMLQRTNSFLWKNYADFCAASGIIGGIKKDESQQDYRYCTMYASFWDKASCHRSNDILLKNYKLTGYFCPVDVYVYDSDNKLCLSIIDDIITLNDREVFALCSFGEKAVVTPSEKDYKIKVIATDDGNFDYAVSEFENGVSKRDVEYKEIPLTNGLVFLGNLPAGNDVRDDKYDLLTAKYASECKIVSLPNKTSYRYKEKISTEGIVLEIEYTDGTIELLEDTGKMTFSGLDTNSTGTKNVTVTYEDVSAQFQINVKYTWWQWIIVILLFGWIWY